MATFRPKSVFISCSFIAAGACSEIRAVRPLIPIFCRRDVVDAFKMW